MALYIIKSSHDQIVAINHFLLTVGGEKWLLYVKYKRKHQWLKLEHEPKPTPKPGMHAKMRNIWKRHDKCHEVPCNSSINWRLKSSAKAMFSVWQCPTTYRADIVKEKIAKFNWELIPHPPCAPDLAPPHHHLFRSLSNGLEDRKFENEDELKRYLFDSKPEELYASVVWLVTFSLNLSALIMLIRYRVRS